MDCSNCFERFLRNCQRPFKLEYLALRATIKYYIDKIQNENKEFNDLLCLSKWKNWVFQYEKTSEKLSCEELVSIILKGFQTCNNVAELQESNEVFGDVDRNKRVLRAEEIISLILERNTSDNPQRNELFKCIDELTTHCIECFSRKCEKCGYYTTNFMNSKKFHGHYSFCTKEY